MPTTSTTRCSESMPSVWCGTDSPGAQRARNALPSSMGPSKPSSDALPSYREDVVSVELAGKLKDAYQQLQDDITATLQEHRGNRSVLSTMLNALLVYPDHPYGLGTLYGSRYNPEIQQRETFVIAETEDLDEGEVYPKEQALIDEIKSQLARGRKCQVFAVYTNKHDVPARLEKLLRAEGIRTAVL